MTATLRVVLDQAVAPTDHDLEIASVELARALVEAQPSGTAVAAIVPASSDDAPDIEQRVPGLAGVHRTAMGRTRLASAWQLGVVAGVGGGMIHSPTLLAPLVKHDRAHDHDQTVVTLWDLEPWLRPHEVSRSAAAAQKALLKRAVRYADAVVVPTHAHAHELDDIAPLRGRVRVVPGAPPARFGLPTDAEARRRDLAVPPRYVVVAGGVAGSDGVEDALRGVVETGDDGLEVVTLSDTGDTSAIVDLASAAGLPERRVRPLSNLDAGDRAALFAGALAFVAPSVSTKFPWRTLEALVVGAPVVAASTPLSNEILADGAQLVSASSPEAIAGALGRLSGDDELRARMSVLAADRGRAFGWRDTAERVWHLHAEL